MSAERFAGRTVLVTGGSGGIGAEICRRFAAESARVWIHYGAGRDAAEALRAELEASRARDPRVVGADLRDPEAVAAMVGRVVDESGRLDILVNNAGIFERHPLAETSFDAWREAWDRTLGINLLGPAHACWHAARHMIDAGGGRIVNISSRGAFRGEPDCPAYGASKAGVNALTQSLAAALAPHRIFVYAVAPGFVETAMARPYLTGAMAEAVKSQSPLGRVATVGDVAYWVLAMAADGAEFATGAIVDVNGASYLRT
ncbi:MAG: SDR family NAD(P)-dependent oxidoreductase [Acidobacteriota bacterium]